MKNTISNGVILTEKYSPFLCLFGHNYYDFDPKLWRTNSVLATKRIYDIFPHLVHLEKTEAFFNPKYADRAMLIGGHIDWSENYVMHIWRGSIGGTIPKYPNDIRKMNNTLGEVMRYVYFGSKELVGSSAVIW